MASDLGRITHPESDALGWSAYAWDDEILFYHRVCLTAISEYPCVDGFFIIELLQHGSFGMPSSYPLAGPFETFTAAAAAHRVLYE
jgi:hypothetical protein